MISHGSIRATDPVPAAAGIGRPLRTGYRLNGVVLASVVNGSEETLALPQAMPPTGESVTMVLKAGQTWPGQFPPEPTPAEMAVNIGKAGAKWIAAGFPVLSQARYDERAAACNACPLWDAKARLGLGKCNACGCTALKRWLATERCPHGKWAIAPIPAAGRPPA